MELLIAVVCVLFIIFILDYWLKPKLGFRMPFRLPFIGHIPFLSNKSQLELTKWSRQYGPVYMIQVLATPIVVVNDVAVYLDLCKSGDFDARHESFRLNTLALAEKYGCPKDIFCQDSNPERDANQNFMRNIMRKQQKGSFFKKLAGHVAEGFKKDILDKSVDSVCDPYDTVSTAINNFYYSVCAGSLSPVEGAGTKYALQTSEIIRVCVSKEGAALDMFPWLRFFGNKTYKGLQEVNNNIWKGFLEMKKQIPSVGGNEGIASAFLNDPDRPNVPDDVMACLLLNSCIGTGEPAVSGLYGTLLLLAAHPHAQDRIRAELKSKGLHKPFLPSEGDSLPYLQAVLYECLRYISPVPPFPRKASRDSEIAGVKVPKGTAVIINLHAGHHDPAKWTDPWKFMPERFLDDAGNLLPKSHPIHANFQPFGTMKRYCMGMPLVLDLLMCLVASMVDEFQIEGVGGMDIPYDCRKWYRNALAVIPTRCQLRFSPRR